MDDSDSDPDVDSGSGAFDAASGGGLDLGVHFFLSDSPVIQKTMAMNVKKINTVTARDPETVGSHLIAQLDRAWLGSLTPAQQDDFLNQALRGLEVA